MRTLLISLIPLQAQENHERENMYELNLVDKDSNNVPDCGSWLLTFDASSYSS